MEKATFADWQARMFEVMWNKKFNFLHLPTFFAQYVSTIFQNFEYAYLFCLDLKIKKTANLAPRAVAQIRRISVALWQNVQ